MSQSSKNRPVDASGTSQKVKVSSSASEREKRLRYKIVTLNPKEGRAWCDRTTKRLLKFRTNLPKVLKIVGIVAGVAAGLVVIYFVFKYIVYVIIGIVAIKFLFSLFLATDFLF